MILTRHIVVALMLTMACGTWTHVALAQEAEAPSDAAVDPAEAVDLEAELSPEELESIRKYMQIKWEVGPATADIGHNAQIAIPEGYQMTGAEGSTVWDEITQNPPSNTLATLMPESQSWFLCFTFSEDGYVKDDEAEDLDADAILTSLKEGVRQSNAYREQHGWGAIEVTDWIIKPKFDDDSKNLVWAFGLQDEQGDVSANYNMRVLGRRGVMNVVVVADPAEMEMAVAEMNQVLAGFEYKEGHRYAEFQEGDRIAEYGLTGLIAGGALVAAAKTGLLGKLAKFAKVIILGLIAVVGGIWRFLTGQSKQQDLQ